MGSANRSGYTVEAAGATTVLQALATTTVDRLPTPAPSPSATPASTPGATPATTATAAPMPTPFVPFWIRNHRVTSLWDGPSTAAGSTALAETSSQWCAFLVVRPADDERLQVFDPYSGGHRWIRSFDIGPVGPPTRRPGPKPPGLTCAEDVYEG